MSVPLGRQIGVLAYEQPEFERRLHKLVARRSMRQAEADHMIEGFLAAIKTLEWVRDHKAVIDRIQEQLSAGELSS